MCIFCKIINNEIPCYKIYENNHVLAFLDISPATLGHTLVIPKKHYEHILDLDDEIAEEIMKAVVNVTKILHNKLNVVDFNLENNNGVLAGQEVKHYHMHVIPRYKKRTLVPSGTDCNPTKEDILTIHQKITA